MYLWAIRYHSQRRQGEIGLWRYSMRVLGWLQLWQWKRARIRAQEHQTSRYRCSTLDDPASRTEPSNFLLAYSKREEENQEICVGQHEKSHRNHCNAEMEGQKNGKDGTHTIPLSRTTLVNHFHIYLPRKRQRFTTWITDWLPCPRHNALHYNNIPHSNHQSIRAAGRREWFMIICKAGAETSQHTYFVL